MTATHSFAANPPIDTGTGTSTASGDAEAGSTFLIASSDAVDGVSNGRAVEVAVKPSPTSFVGVTVNE